MEPVVHYKGYTIDPDGKREIIGGPMFRFEPAYEFFLNPRPGPLGEPFPMDTYERWRNEEVLPGVEISMSFNS